MRPRLEAGDRLRIDREARPRIGDIVLAHAGEHLLVHRLIARRDEGWVLRGDDTPEADLPLPPEAILGRALAIEGPRGLRLDQPERRPLDLATALLARLQRATGGRWRRPRPQLLQRFAMRLSQRLLPPRPSEESLLLLALRPEIDAAAEEQAANLCRATGQTPPDWTRVVRLAEQGQVGALAYRGLKRLSAGGALETADQADLEAALTSLRRQRIGSALRWEQSRAIASEILASLATEGIPVQAHKGLALALEVYDPPELRIMGDLDLSVRDADLPRAEALAAETRAALVAENPDRRSASGHHVELDRLAHHDLDPCLSGGGRWRAGSLDWQGIWSRSSSRQLDGHALRVPEPTDLLLCLIANSLRRGFSPMRLIVDIAHTVARHAEVIDWDRLADALARSRLDRRAWVPLGLAADWLGSEIPAALLEPPAGLRTAYYERWMIEAKRRRPWLRLPTRLLWAGAWSELPASLVELMRSRLLRA